VAKNILFLRLTGVGDSFRKNGGDTKSKTSHFNTNYSASIIGVSTDSVLQFNKIEFY